MTRKANTHQVICFESVSFAYSVSVDVLKGLSFTIFDKEHVAILGPSGSGKSTILHMIAGTHRPSKGRVTLRDKNRDSLALMVQGEGLLPWYNITKNFEIAMKIHGIPETEHQERTQHWLSRFGIEHLASRFPGQLSGGQRQRAALARMLALDVELLLLDEPLSSIDELQRERLQRQLGEVFAEESLASVIVTHSVEEAVLLSDTLFIVQDDHPISELEIISNPLTYSQRERANIDFQAFCTRVREALR